MLLLLFFFVCCCCCYYFCFRSLFVFKNGRVSSLFQISLVTLTVSFCSCWIRRAPSIGSPLPTLSEPPPLPLPLPTHRQRPFKRPSSSSTTPKELTRSLWIGSITSFTSGGNDRITKMKVVPPTSLDCGLSPCARPRVHFTLSVCGRSVNLSYQAFMGVMSVFEAMRRFWSHCGPTVVGGWECSNLSPLKPQLKPTMTDLPSRGSRHFPRHMTNDQFLSIREFMFPLIAYLDSFSLSFPS